MEKRKVLGLCSLFILFLAMFSGMAYWLEFSQREDESQTATTAGADAGMQAMEAEAAPPEEEKATSRLVPIGVGVLILSLLSTFLSWAAVDRAFSEEQDVAVISFRDDEGREVMEALSNDTCQSILESLSEEGKTASELSDELDMTIQRVQYNLKKLKKAGLVKADHMKYSSRGKEMDVYTLAKKYFVFGPEE